MEKIELIVTQVPFWFQAIAQLMMIITLGATVVVRLTPKQSDDEKVGKFTAWLLKILHWLPTLGVNPQTKKLEEALEDLKVK